MKIARPDQYVFSQLQRLNGLPLTLATSLAVIILAIGASVFATGPTQSLHALEGSLSHLPAYSSGTSNTGHLAPLKVTVTGTKRPTAHITPSRSAPPASNKTTTQAVAAATVTSSISPITVTSGALSLHFTVHTTDNTPICAISGSSDQSHVYLRTADLLSPCEQNVNAYVQTDTATTPGTFNVPITAKTASGATVTGILAVQVVSDPSFWLTAGPMNSMKKSGTVAAVTDTLTVTSDPGYTGTPNITYQLPANYDDACTNISFVPATDNSTTNTTSYLWTCDVPAGSTGHTFDVTFMGQDGQVVHSTKASISF